jgi:hypothetical protein
MPAPDPNLSFRPKSYVWPLGLKTHALSSIKGADRNAFAAQFFEEGREAEIPAKVLQPSLSESDRRRAGAIHPSLMGGEYLPDNDPGEIEIARITLASVTQDVTSVYAARTSDGIRFRVVDEYDGETLTAPSEFTSAEPLTLGELFDFVMEALDLYSVLEMNFGDSGYAREQVLAFFDASSEFYPEWDRLLRSRVEAWLDENAPEGDDGVE